MIPLLAAFQFLTLIPPIIRRPFRDRELGASLAFYPLVGLTLGAALYAANLGLTLYLPAGLRAVLVVTLWITLVGAFHFDGFLDSLDGLFGGYTPQTRLEIMHDERVGAFGMAGGVLLLLAKTAALGSLSPAQPALLLIPALSRWGMAAAITLFPYARDKGLGRVMKDHAGWQQLIAASSLALLIAWFTAQVWGLGALLLTVVLTWLLSRFVLSRIPGLTGDIYGAINEMCELCLLMYFTILPSP